MTRAACDTLLIEFCRATHVADPEPIVQSGAFLSDGIRFQLVPAEPSTHGAVLTCDLGPLSSGDRETSYRRLMELSTLLCQPQGAWACINNRTGVEALMVRMFPHQLSLPVLMELLSRLTFVAHAWSSPSRSSLCGGPFDPRPTP
jgi:hypothetical protein